MQIHKCFQLQQTPNQNDKDVIGARTVKSCQDSEGDVNQAVCTHRLSPKMSDNPK